MCLIETRHSSKLRQAISGKNKTDVIDADLLASSVGLFGLSASELPTSGRVALRRSVRRRHRMTAEAHNAEVRLWSLAAWAFPDLWKANGWIPPSRQSGAGTLAPPRPAWEEPTSPHLHRYAGPTCVKPATPNSGRNGSEKRPEAGPGSGPAASTSTSWPRWITELIDDIDVADRKIDEATGKATRLWRSQWGSDELWVSVSGMGQVTAPVARAYLGDATQFADSKKAAAYVGLNPSN